MLLDKRRREQRQEGLHQESPGGNRAPGEDRLWGAWLCPHLCPGWLPNLGETPFRYQYLK